MSAVSSLLSCEEFHSIAAQCVKKDFEILSVSESSLDSENGGFISDYLQYDIRVRLPDSTESSRKFFCKILPSSPQQQEYVKEVQFFAKEFGFYTKLLPLLLKYQKQDTSDDRRVKGRWGPQCYLIRNDIVVMEDLGAVGYKVYNYRDLFDWNHCVVSLKKIANFHAATIIFEEKEETATKNPCRIENMYPELFCSVIDRTMPDDENVGWFPSGVRALTDLVPYLPKYKHDKKLQQTIQEKLPSVLKALSALAKSDKYRNVVCHGDLWANNIMYRYNKDNHPETLRLIDFQILRYAPPSADIIIFLFTSTSREFRERYSQDLLKIYYEEFSSELLRNGLSANKLLSFDELKDSFQCFLPAGRALAPMYHEMILIDPIKKQSVISAPEKYKIYFSIDRSSDVRESFECDEIYRNRLEESMDELIEKEILNDKRL